MKNHYIVIKPLHIILVMLLCSLFLPSLSAGSKKNEQLKSKTFIGKNDPDLIPVKVKIKVTPDKTHYKSGDTVSLYYELSLNKSDPNYNQTYKYMIISDDDFTTRTGSGWKILKSDLKEISKLNLKNDKLSGTILMENNGSLRFEYCFSIVRISENKSGELLRKYNLYYDCAISFKIGSKSYEETAYPTKKLRNKVNDKVEYLGL